MVLCLFQRHIENNLINFRGEDIESIYRKGVDAGLEFTKLAHIEHDDS